MSSTEGGYELGFPTRSAEKAFDRFLGRLDADAYRHIRGRMEDLRREPRPPGKSFKILRPPLEIFHRAANYRLRVGDYRILYDVDDAAKRVILIAIRRRSEKTYRG